MIRCDGPGKSPYAIDTEALAREVLVGIVTGLAEQRDLVEHTEEIDALLERATAGEAYPNQQALGDAFALVFFTNRREVFQSQ